MSTPQMIPMLDEDGNSGDVPQDQVQNAVSKGFKIGTELTDPTGKVGVVPLDRVHDAVKAGFQLKGAPVPKPQAPTLSPSEEMPLSQATEDAKGNTMQTVKELGIPAAGGAVAGAGISSGLAALPAVMPHTIAGVKAIGKWAHDNPAAALMLYTAVKELVPGAKKAMGMIKDAPDLAK